MKSSLSIGLYLLLAMGACGAQAQVELRPLSSNPQLKESHKKPLRKNTSPLSLPFVEDFSSSLSPYPDPVKWRDRQVFINSDFPFFPPSIGVATFDALDESGQLYPQANSFSFDADTLSSQVIRLDSLFSPIARPIAASDSLYFSFYYQPGGGFGDSWLESRRGSAPKKGDMLILEFFNKLKNDWEIVWSKEGENLASFCPLCPTDTAEQVKNYFRQVLIPITNTQAYLHKDFRFRFRNLSSIDPNWKSGGGQWHLDYIRLDINRHRRDYYSKDLTFVERPTRFLKKFEAMPARQFALSDLRDNVDVRIRNLDQTAYVVQYHYEIRNSLDQIVSSIPSSGNANANIYPFSEKGFNTDPDLSKQNILYRFPNLNQNAEVFTIKHFIRMAAANDLILSNDEISRTLPITDYYAYDDGSPEAGLGLNYDDGVLLQRFPLRRPDTLSALQLWFNDSKEDFSRAGFFWQVWSAGSDSLPKNLLYESCFFRRNLIDTAGFQTYLLDSLLPLPAGLFFVGVRQSGQQHLNYGFDQNNNASSELLYFNQQSDSWNQVLYYGSLMMRPFFGKKFPSSSTPKQEEESPWTVFPNPSRGSLHIQSSTDFQNLRLYDLSGRLLREYRFAPCRQIEIQLNGLKAGLYLLQKDHTTTQRIVYQP